MSIVNKYVFDICFKFHVLTLVTLGLKRQQSTSNWTSTSYQAWWFWHFSLCDLLSLASRRRRHRNPQRGVKEGIQTKWIFQYSFFHLLIWFLFFFLGKKNETHIKKPLNAFMLYMKEMRPVVQAECTLKESAAINQLLGRRVRQQVWIFFNLESLIPLLRLYVKVLFDEFVYFLQFARQFF